MAFGKTHSKKRNPFGQISLFYFIYSNFMANIFFINKYAFCEKKPNFERKFHLYEKKYLFFIYFLFFFFLRPGNVYRKGDGKFF